VGSYLQSYGAYLRARPLFERALAIREKVLGPEHLDTAASLNNLAIAFKTIGSLPLSVPQGRSSPEC
jgi:Tetratricopeptide repeat